MSAPPVVGKDSASAQTEQLHCPNCGTTGAAVLSQAKPDSEAYHDGTDQNVRAELVPVGFKPALHEFGCDFYCAKCGSLAHHTYPGSGLVLIRPVPN